MARKCSPPKSVTVKPYWRAKPRRHGPRHPRAGQTYYAAEDAQGHTCGHHHRTLTSGMACAKRKNRAAGRVSRKGATYITERKTTR
jgi:hypothetical protein